MVKFGDQLDARCGQYYYHYGDAILKSLEASADIFGGMDGSAPQPGTIKHAPQADDEGGESTAEGAAEPRATGDTDDTALAWELLEAARCCFEKMDEGTAKQLQTADVYSRLGDLMSWATQNFTQAIEDYKKAEEIRQEEPMDAKDKYGIANFRSIVAENFNIARIYEYSTLEEFPDKVKETEAAYTRAKAAMEQAMAVITPEEMEDPVMGETMQSIESKLAQIAEDATSTAMPGAASAAVAAGIAGAEAGGSSASGVTTTGFSGGASSSGFGAPTMGAGRAAAAPTALAVKKKRKAPETAPSTQ